MGKATIYTVADGKLTAMSPSAPENEDTMQELVANYPEIIADEDGPLLLIQREQPIADTLNGAGRWSVDHLFVTRAGVPVLAELKRATDTRLRREVVGQLLDYAAHAAAYWRPGTIAAAFAHTVEATGGNPEEVLADFVGDDGVADEFWQRVDDSFAAGRMKLVFVADVIPSELARVVEFLNEQMKAQVKAVELSWYEGSGVKAFVPRVIGETQRANAAKAANKGAISPSQWIDERVAPLGSEEVNAARNFVSVVESAGGELYVPLSRGSIRARVTQSEMGESVFPFGLEVGKQGKIYLNLNTLKGSAAFATEASRKDLYDRLTTVVGPLSTKRLDGYPAFAAAKLNEPQVQLGLQEFLRHLAHVITKQEGTVPSAQNIQEQEMLVETPSGEEVGA
jgi:hypothetical protein